MLGYVAAMAVVLALARVLLYRALGAARLEELDPGLGAHAGPIRAELRGGAPPPEWPRGLLGAREIFEQVRGPHDDTVEATPGLPARLFPAATIARVAR